jgi:hypothetical protein
LSVSGTNPSGTYKPTDYIGSGGGGNQQQLERRREHPINHPGPSGSTTFASAFGGAWLSNTTWTLKIRDDADLDSGSLADGRITIDYRLIGKPHDFDGGGFSSDILWQNSDGTPGIWLMAASSPRLSVPPVRTRRGRPIRGRAGTPGATATSTTTAAPTSCDRTTTARRASG